MATDTSLSRRNTAKWVAVTGAAQAVRFVLTLLSLSILARLLSPDDFGLIATAGPVLAFSALLQNLGLNETLIQQPKLEVRHVNATFYVMVVVSLLVCAVLYVGAPIYADVMQEPRLVDVVRAMAVISFIVAIGGTPFGLLNRGLRFRQLAIIDLLGIAAGLGFGVAFALATRSYWALVVMYGTTAFVHLICALASVRWRPGIPGFDEEFRKLLGLGAGFSTFNMLNFLSRNVDVLLLARLHGTVAVGLYERAYKMMLAPLWQTVTPFGRVMMPVLSKLREDRGQYRERYFEATAFLMVVVQPGVLVAVVFPTSSVAVVLGPNWLAASPILFWLSLTALHQIQTLTLSWLFISQGRAGELAIAGAIGAGVIVTAFVAGASIGPVGVAVAYAMADIFLRAPLTWWMAGRKGQVDLSSLLSHCAPHAAAMTVAGAALATSKLFWRFDHMATLLCGIVISYCVYGLTLSIFPEKRRLLATFLRGIRRRPAMRS
jgi:PST family polysaccharide transporter